MTTEPAVMPSLTSGLDEPWLRLTQEDILEPDLPICDPHHHLWERPEHRYLVPEFLADAGSGHTIVSTVFLECGAFYRPDGPEAMRSVGEVASVSDLTAMSASGAHGSTRVAAAIVGFADLTLGARAEATLTALMEAGGGRFRGVRYSAARDDGFVITSSHSRPPAELYRDPTFRQGFACLGRLSLTFGAWVYHPQIAVVIDLARAFPTANIIMCHVGGPLGYGPYAGKADEVFASWKPKITELAACPNVSIKLGGMINRLAAYDYRARPAPVSSAELADYWRPYMETCIELFGPERCMFESNFPVEKMGIGWATLWNAFKRIAAGASAEEKLALFSDTARRVYRLD